MARFGDRLQAVLDERGVSQTDLARHLGKERQTVNGWIQSKREPEFAVLNEIANYLHVSTDYLLGRTDVPLPGPPAGADPIDNLDLWLRGTATREDIDMVKDLLALRRKKTQEKEP